MTYNIIPLLLFLSITLNILFVWYLRQILKRFIYICANINDLKSMVELYMKHLDVIAELEMFFKDPHIEELRQHTQDLIQQLVLYEEFYDIISSGDIENIPNKLEDTKDEQEDSTGSGQQQEEDEKKEV